VILPRGHLSVAGIVQIVDGTATCGRLRVYAFDGWRSVCPNMFDDIDATVACIHMGFGCVCASATITVIRMTTANSQTKTANIAKDNN